MATFDELMRRALLTTRMKTGPQISALRSLLSDSAAQYSRTRRVNASNEAGIVQATRDATPQVAGAFDQALQSAAAQRAALGVGATDPQAQAFERRVGESKAHALVDLSDRQTRATEGRIFANQSARDEYLGGKAKIQNQILEVLRQAGDQTAATLSELQDKEQSRALTRRGQDITIRGQDLSHADRQAALAQRAKAKAKAKVKYATTEDHARARDAITEAVAQIKRQRELGATSRAEIIQLLTTGRSAQKVTIDGKDVTLPAIRKLPADFVRAAANLVFDGSLSRGDLKRLHNRRLKVRSLGYKVRRPGALG